MTTALNTTMSTDNEVLTATHNGVYTITINREARRNALNEKVVAALIAGVDEAESRADVRAIVLTGAGGQAFCAGADLNKNVEGGAFVPDYAQPRHYVVSFFKRLQTCRLPVIARVNGHAMAGGFGLLCSCDMAVATDDATFGTPESKIGVTPMMILPAMLRVLPQRKLMEMCITGEPIDAAQALEMGIVNYVVPRAELDNKLQWLLGRITDKSPTSIRLGKQAFHAMRDMSYDGGLEYAQAMLPSMSSTQDAREGMAAFQQKRKPLWTGR